MPDVRSASEIRRRIPVSQPKAIATTPTNTATPSPRRIHSSAPRDRFMNAKTLLPANSASASEQAAPSREMPTTEKPYARSRPATAAPVRINPRIGPAHGAHSNPVDTPRTSDRPMLGAASPPCPVHAPPNRTNGRDKISAKPGKQQCEPQHRKNHDREIRPSDWRARSRRRRTWPPRNRANVTAMPARTAARCAEKVDLRGRIRMATPAGYRG